jgi:NAD(P)H dehydrogenase (quinone)
MSAKLKDFIERSVEIHGKLTGKVGAAFTSSVGQQAVQKTTLLSMQVLLINGIVVQGRANDKHYGAAAVGFPNKKDLKYCMELGKRTAGLVVKSMWHIARRA